MTIKRGLRGYLIAPRRQIKEFLTTVTLQQLGAGLINIFEPIYLFQQGISPSGIIWYYVAVYVPYLLLLPLGGRFAKRFGYEHSLAIGTLFNMAYFGALAAIPFVHEAIFVAPFLYCLQKTFWWPAYHANFARYSRRREVAREVGTMQGLYNIAGGIAPVIGGFVAQYTGFGTLLVIAIGILLLSVVPMFTTPEKFVPEELTFREQWAFLLRPAYRRRLIGAFGFGAEFVNMVTWPLFVFLVLGTTSQVGIVIGISVGVMVVVSLLVSRVVDRTPKSARRVLVWTSIVQMASWLVRPWVAGFASITAAGSVGSASLNVTYIPFYDAIYRDAKANHVMIEVVAAEMALIIGKLLVMAAVLVVLAATGSLAATFFVGLAATIFFFFFK